VDTPDAGGIPDSLFPQPDSPGGRLLGRLVSLQVPGLPVEIALSALAQSVRLAPDVAASALSRLAADGLVQLETEPESEQLVVTVMLAPPLEDFGITPDWGEAADQGPSPDGAPSGTPDSAPSPDAQLAGGAPPVTPLHPDPPPAAAPAETPRRSRTRRATTASAPVSPGPPAPAPPPPPAGSAAKPKTSPARQPAPASGVGASVDETVQARNFVERFERLLSECETWRRRAQEAEERAKVAERRLATAERRAELAEGRLATAQERLRSWGELTRRMQQLARQADSVNRARPARPKQPGRAERPPSSGSA
jgi:hypothetical protein